MADCMLCRANVLTFHPKILPAKVTQVAADDRKDFHLRSWKAIVRIDTIDLAGARI